MQRQILNALTNSPRVTKEFSIYLRGIKLDITKFMTEDSISNKLYYFINFFNDLYNLNFIFRSNQVSIFKDNNEILYFSRTTNGNNYIETMLAELITYSENPF